jgi:hypothetical protein
VKTSNLTRYHGMFSAGEVAGGYTNFGWTHISSRKVDIAVKAVVKIGGGGVELHRVPELGQGLLHCAIIESPAQMCAVTW